ncbi:CII-like transcriptional regulator [Variovorax phage VarioGold]|uniref:phage regulatory CII family protein n=1 Tax=Variovorax sp. ZS18.2.2 TaxID=2971255 RepID=UPI002151E61D|nr:phage regulatory CII family protein [Variovorax sp. ZS18.2.2]MCR6477543.1 hypothetical protein [Variovorax sp. ZS18.2.2]UYD72094.1 CII-like transcriptional regulator [Variovorax phage VarioGold]
MSSIAHPNLTVSFDPALPEHWGSLREYIAFRVQDQRLNAANLASKMDLSPSTLSRKLKQPEGDTQRLNCDDLEAYIKATKDVGSVIAYLVAKYMESPEARSARALIRFEELAGELNEVIAVIKAGRV